jgi:GNAT superfamily N-acetyltransferase/acyl carrier protein
VARLVGSIAPLRRSAWQVRERREGDTVRGNNPAPLREAVFEALRQIAPQIAPVDLHAATPLRDQVDLDSMDWLNFLVALHDKLGIDIPEADYSKLVTLDDLLAYLKERHPTAPQHAPGLVREHQLSDGRTVTIRPIRADDADRIRNFLAASSEESRYKRFHQWVHAPSKNLVHFLTDIDPDRHLALVCTAAHGTGEEIVGEARCIATTDGKNCELGVLIEDSWRKTGVAGLLMEALIGAARERGFAVMEGLVLASNTAMLQFAHALGFAVEPIGGERSTVRIYRRLQPTPIAAGAADECNGVRLLR